MSSKKVNKLTYDRLKEVLFYDQNTGTFLWKKVTCNRVKSGQIAGTKHKNGYRYLRIDGQKYFEHRLAWLYMHKEWPNGEIDHINRIKDCNKIENLRVVTSSQNKQNKFLQNNNKSGFRGVSWHKIVNKWRARITFNNKERHIGLFDSKEDAYKAYLDAAEKLHTHNPVVS